MFFLYCRQTLLVELTRDVNRSSGGEGAPGRLQGAAVRAPGKKKALNPSEQDAERRFHAGAVPATVPGSVITEREAKDVTRRVFGAGGGMLYRAVTQLIGDFSRTNAENPKPPGRSAAAEEAYCPTSS